jgi:HTH-type transcriptional regulator, competence development regulator
MRFLKNNNTFGAQIRKMRENNGQTLKVVAEKLEIDASFLAKIESNERQPNKIVLAQIANYFQVDEKNLNLQMISDQFANTIYNENIDICILKIAEKKIKYLKNINNDK